MFLIYALFFFFTTTVLSLETKYPLITATKITQNKLKIRINPQLKKYLRANFFVAEYEDKTLDLTKINFSITSIPFITTIIPVIWASDELYTIDVMDEDLFYALKKINNVFRKFYPSLAWSGKLIPKELKKNYPKQNTNTLGVLFSGGLDAVASSFKHFEKDQLLITIGGSDVKFYEKKLWTRVKKHTQAFSECYNKEYTCIRSNFTTLAYGKRLKQLSPHELTQWWALTSQSLGYTGLTAPLLYHYGIQHLVIGSSHTADLPMPYGTHPLIDNEINFAGCTVHHDCGHLDRLGKIKLISKTCKNYNLPYPRLRVCWGKDKQGGNCNNCEKCLRTINELLIMSKEPKEFGFEIETKTAIKITKKFFTSGLKLKARQLWHWHCVQQQLHHKINLLLQDHCAWLGNLQLERFAKDSFEINKWRQQDIELADMWRKSIKKSI